MALQLDLLAYAKTPFSHVAYSCDREECLLQTRWLCVHGSADSGQSREADGTLSDTLGILRVLCVSPQDTFAAKRFQLRYQTL